MKHYKITSTEFYESIKLGIDALAKWYYVARQLDGATPQPVQKMDFEGLLNFVARQKRMAREVHTCYEAGAFGCHLHHRLTALGVTNYVVQPQDWDERGNLKAFSVVRVPMAEREGFEPSVRFPVRSLSKGVLSTTQPPFRESGREVSTIAERARQPLVEGNIIEFTNSPIIPDFQEDFVQPTRQ